MDALTHVLRALRLEPTAFKRVALAAPWGLRLSALDHAAFHYVEQGTAWLRILDAERAQQRLLQQGDIVVVSHTAAYELLDDPPAGHGAITAMMFSELRPELPAVSPLFASIPPLIHIPGQDGRAIDWLTPPLDLIAFEDRHDYPGKDTVISRVLDILFIMVVRSWIGYANPNGGGWLNALYHPQIGQVLGCIHQQPERAWTVEDLAAVVNLSRSAFASQFTALVGEAPMTYLARWRMQLAATLLVSQPAATLEGIAQRVGYSSAYAFSKAFKRIVGVSPSAYRQLPRM